MNTFNGCSTSHLHHFSEFILVKHSRILPIVVAAAAAVNDDVGGDDTTVQTAEYPGVHLQQPHFEPLIVLGAHAAALNFSNPHQ